MSVRKRSTKRTTSVADEPDAPAAAPAHPAKAATPKRARRKSVIDLGDVPEPVVTARELKGIAYQETHPAPDAPWLVIILVILALVGVGVYGFAVTGHCIEISTEQHYAYGIESAPAFKRYNPDHSLVGIFVFLMLAAMAVRTVYHNYRQIKAENPNASIWDLGEMTILISLYSVGTAIFAVCLFTLGQSRPVLSLAALHNLCEWWIMARLFLRADKVWGARRLAVCYVWAQIAFCLLAPTFRCSLLVVETCGIACDYLMPIGMVMMYFNRPGLNVTGMWTWGIAASLMHFGQIWTLVLGGIGFPQLNPIMLQFVLIFSGVTCFFSWTEFAIRWDQMVREAHDDTNPDHPDPTKPHPYRYENMKTKDAVLLIVISALCGLATINAPFAYYMCPMPSEYHPEMSSFIGVTLISAKAGMAADLQKLLATELAPAHSAEGNKFFRLFARDQSPQFEKLPYHDYDFMFVEGWATPQDMIRQAALSQKGLWATPEFKSLIAEKDGWLKIVAPMHEMVKSLENPCCPSLFCNTYGTCI